MLVVTHIDEVDSETLNYQCKQVKEHVTKQIEGMKAVATFGTPVIKVLGGGESLQVNCLEGFGIDVLKENLQRFVAEMPWHKELLPAARELTEVCC